MDKGDAEKHNELDCKIWKKKKNLAVSTKGVQESMVHLQTFLAIMLTNNVVYIIKDMYLTRQ